MELRQYGAVIWRRRWLALAIVALATLFSIYSALTAAGTYGSEATFTVRQQPVDPNKELAVFTFDNYYRFISSEYLVDDYTQVIESGAFALSVLETMKGELASGKFEPKNPDKFKADLEKLKPSAITDAMGADRRHRELRVFAVTSSPDLAVSMMDASAIVLTSARIKPIRGEIIDDPVFGQLDPILHDDVTTSTAREITNAVTRVIIGIVAALALAFLLEYLDRSVRDERDAKTVLDLPVLGAIPRI